MGQRNRKMWASGSLGQKNIEERACPPVGTEINIDEITRECKQFTNTVRHTARLSRDDDDEALLSLKCRRRFCVPNVIRHKSEITRWSEIRRKKKSCRLLARSPTRRQNWNHFNVVRQFEYKANTPKQKYWKPVSSICWGREEKEEKNEIK